MIVDSLEKRKKSKFNFLVLILILFLVVFPKGGIKFKNIPITWGYLFLAIISVSTLFRKKYTVRKDHIFSLIALVPFQVYSLLSMYINGIQSSGFFISFLVSFLFLPFIFFLVFSEYIENLDLEYFFKIFKRSILFISSYGIFLFFYRGVFGYLLEIPLLTVNWHEKGLLETIKCINHRGFFLKLISTYNNGNIYGICLLMVLPLYKYLEKSIVKKSIVKLSIILTLSRTVWIGYILADFFFNFFIIKNKKKSLIKFLISSICFIVILLIFAKFYLHKPFSWYFDPTLGGRLVDKSFEVNFFSSLPFAHIEEMVYLSIFDTFGFLGLLLFIIGICFSLFNYLFKNINVVKSPIDLCIFFGLLTYLIISISDSATLYLPVMAFYWFLSSFLQTKKRIFNEFS
ncbi:MAG: hypothetical protein K940chlam5_00213 [Candidatus Anoxychlamydiales bacterium]|nr:hypothetical protein [Candidatus Anoxychlamydiales bacterium]